MHHPDSKGHTAGLYSSPADFDGQLNTHGLTVDGDLIGSGLP